MKPNQLSNISIKRLFFILFILFFFSQGFAQNLVRNWSFEDTLSCPINVGQINKSKHWFSPRGGGGSSEYFNYCSNHSTPNMPYPNWTSIPLNAYGSQIPMKGKGYGGIGVFVLSDQYDHEYIETKLSQGLNPTINYYIEYWVSLADRSAYAIENMGAYISTDTVHYSPSIIMNLNAQIEHTSGILSDTANWVKISGYFKPDKDGYQFLTIGNFNTNDSTNYQNIGSSGTVSYYYIENVVVIDSALQHTIGFESLKFKSFKFQVYPNPACGIVNIEFSNRFDSQFEVQIFDIIGRKRYAKSFANSKNLELDISDLESGMFFIRIIGKGGSLISQKLIIE